MMINFGNICLYLTLSSALIAGFGGLYNKAKLVFRFSFFQFCMLTIVLLKLLNAYINTDLTLQNVMLNSHHLMPMVYKIAGLWGNYEGSMLLFTWLLSLVSLLFMLCSKLSQELTAKILSIQSLILSPFLLFIVLASNPFTLTAELMPEARGFNPLLQDIALSIHPPILYAGYTSFSIIFSASIVVLTSKSYDSTWLEKFHDWVRIPWMLLTFGISLGAWWAYRELGWGGFWFWDPVENISLIVWLFATSLLHIIKRNGANPWAFILSLATFLSVILGVFLVRSGVLVSVHSFAFDISKGIFLLAIFAVFFIASIVVFFKSPSSKLCLILLSERENRSIWITLNAILLSIIALVILMAILYPVFYQMVHGRSISVSESFYQYTLSFIFIPTIVIAAVYSSGSVKAFIKNIIIAGLFSVSINAYKELSSILSLLYLFSSLLLLSSLISHFSKYLKNISPSFFAMVLGHVGMALLMIGVALYYAWGAEDHFLMKKNDQVTIADYSISLIDVEYDKKDNYLFRQAILQVEKNNEPIGVARPQLRFYPIEKTFTTESGVLHTISGDIYTTISELNAQNQIMVKVQYKPFMYLIWGALMMIAFSVSINFKR